MASDKMCLCFYLFPIILIYFSHKMLPQFNKLYQEFKLKMKSQLFRAQLIKILHVYGAVTLFTSGLILNAFQAILYITLRPFSKNWFRRINRYFCASMYAQVLFLPEWLASTDIIIYVDPEEFKKYYGKEHSFCIINHTYEIDWLINWIFCDKIGCLGNFKACSKQEAKWLPTFGWCWIMADFIFIDRCFAKDKEIITKQITELVNYPDPIWLTFYPEGTRLTPEKHEVSKKFSKTHGLPVYKHHMLPRKKGFLACLPLMKGKVKGLYDIVLSFQGGKDYRPSYHTVAQANKVVSHIYLKRIPFEEVPQDTEEAVKFLYDLYERKDRLQDSFFKTGDFFAESGIERLPAMKIERGYTSLFNFLFWNISLTLPLIWYWTSLIYSQQYVQFGVIAVFIITAFWAMNRLIDYSSIKTASTYGMESTSESEK